MGSANTPDERDALELVDGLQALARRLNPDDQLGSGGTPQPGARNGWCGPRPAHRAKNLEHDRATEPSPVAGGRTGCLRAGSPC